VRSRTALATVLALLAAAATAPGANAAGEAPLGLGDCGPVEGVHSCSGLVRTWDGIPLDTTLTLPSAGASIQLKATVKNKTMLILVDTGSSHSFVSSQFVHITQLPTSPMPKQKIRLADGSCMSTAHQVKDLQWYIQGKTFTEHMIVMDKLPYDAILGFDWLQQFSPMQCDWVAKTL
jgi:hypothetical protein